MDKPPAQGRVHPVMAVILILLTSAPMLIYFLLPSPPQRPLPSPLPPPPANPRQPGGLEFAPPAIAADDPNYIRLPARQGTIIDISKYQDIAALKTTRVSVDIDNLALPDALDTFAAASP